MKKDDIKYINNLYPYFKMLDNINNCLTKIMQDNTNNEPYQNEELFYEITSDLLRLLPYKTDKKSKKIVLLNEDGILLLSGKIKFIREKYNKILNYEPFYKVLDDAREIRNKYIHEPHNISYGFSVGGSSICTMGLRYKTKLLSISSISLAPIVFYLNEIFESIENETLELIETNENYKEYPYYSYLMNLDFSRDRWNYTRLPEYIIPGF